MAIPLGLSANFYIGEIQLWCVTTGQRLIPKYFGTSAISKKDQSGTSARTAVEMVSLMGASLHFFGTTDSRANACIASHMTLNLLSTARARIAAPMSSAQTRVNARPRESMDEMMWDRNRRGGSGEQEA